MYDLFSDIYKVSLGPTIEGSKHLTVQHDIEIYKLSIVILEHL